MCDYCCNDNTKESLRGSDGILFDQGKYHLYIEHFQNEVFKIEVNFCLKCGRKLKGGK